MREQAQAKSAGRELTYAILPGLLLSAQWLRISLISNQPSPPQISHSHTKYYNSSAIPGPAPASVPPKYQYLREQTPSCQSIIASHGTAAEGLEKKGGRGVQQVDEWAEPLWRTEQTQAEWRRVIDHSSWISYKPLVLPLYLMVFVDVCCWSIPVTQHLICFTYEAIKNHSKSLQ